MATEQITRKPVLAISNSVQNPDGGILNLRKPRTTQVISLTTPEVPKKPDLLNWAVLPDSSISRIVENDDHDQHQHGHNHDHQHEDEGGDDEVDLILGQGLKPLVRLPKVELSPNKELGLWGRSIGVIVDAALNLKLAPDLSLEEREILEDTARYRANFAADPRNIQPAELSFNRESDLAILSQLKKRGSSVSNLAPAETAEALLLMRSTLFGQKERDNLAKSLKHFDSEDFLHQGTISEIQPSLNYQVTIGHERAVFAYSQILQVIALSMALEARGGPISNPTDQIIIQLSSFFQEFGFTLSNLRDGHHFATLNPDQNLQDFEQALFDEDFGKISTFKRMIAHGGPEKINGFHAEVKIDASGQSRLELHSHGVTEQLQKASQINEQTSPRSRVNLVSPNQPTRAQQRPPAAHLGPLPLRPHLQPETLSQTTNPSIKKDEPVVNPLKLVRSFSLSLNPETFRARPARRSYLRNPLPPLIEAINFSQKNSTVNHLPLLPNREVVPARKRENPSNPDTTGVEGTQKPTAGDLRNHSSPGKENFLAKVATPDSASPKAKMKIAPVVGTAISEETLATPRVVIEKPRSAKKTPQPTSTVIREVPHSSATIAKTGSNLQERTLPKSTFHTIDRQTTPWVNTKQPLAVEQTHKVTGRNSGGAVTQEISHPSTSLSVLTVIDAPRPGPSPKEPDSDLRLPQVGGEQIVTSMSSSVVQIGTSLAAALRQMETANTQSEVARNSQEAQSQVPESASQAAQGHKAARGGTSVVIKGKEESVSGIAVIQQEFSPELGTNEIQQQRLGTASQSVQNQNNSTQGSKVTPQVMAPQQTAFALAINPRTSDKLSQDPVEIGETFRKAYLEAQETHLFAT